MRNHGGASQVWASHSLESHFAAHLSCGPHSVVCPLILLKSAVVLHLSPHIVLSPGKNLRACREKRRIRINWLPWTTAAAAAKSLQSCRTLCNPIDGSPPGSPSLGFSRQEHWSELPFPSPMHESEKWKWSRSVVPDSSQPHGPQPTRLLRPWGFPGKSTWTTAES